MTKLIAACDALYASLFKSLSKDEIAVLKATYHLIGSVLECEGKHE